MSQEPSSATLNDNLRETVKALLIDIESNAAIGEPDWDGIRRRIRETMLALSLPSAVQASDVARRIAVIEGMLAEFPSGYDEYGVYLEWKERLDTMLGALDLAAVSPSSSTAAFTREEATNMLLVIRDSLYAPMESVREKLRTIVNGETSPQSATKESSNG